MSDGDRSNQRSVQIDAAIAEYLELAEQGKPAEREAFLARHAAIADDLREFLGNDSALRQQVPPPATAERPPPGTNQTIPATCPNGHSLRIAAKLAGRRANCPKCQAPFVVPRLPETEQPKPGAKLTGESASTIETIKFTSQGSDGQGISAGDRGRFALAAHPQLGQKFGQFELVDLIGEGGFGAVYRARNSRLDRDVALKLPRPGMLGDAEEVARFLREAQAAAQLHHPHIVAVYDAGQIDGVYFIASAYIAGKTLKEELKQRNEKLLDAAANGQTDRAAKFTPREIATLVAKLAAALNYAHQKGIFHRDVKPENIMLDAEGEPHLMDFGLARRREGDTLRTREGIKMGTPAYMSPEQAKGASHLADARSDLWSLGVILYELLTGRLPFDSKQLEVLLTDIIQHEPEPLRKIDPAIPRDLETICLKCLAKEPVRRYPSCQHLADELQSWLDGEAISARPISIMERSWMWAKRHPGVALLSSVLSLLLAAIVVIAPIVAVQQALLRRSASGLLAEKVDAVNKLDEKVQELNVSNETQKKMLHERNAALQEAQSAKDAAEKGNVELTKTSKQLRDAIDKLNPRLAATLFEFAVSDYESGRYPAALARLGNAYAVAPADHPLRASSRRMLPGWAAQAGQIDFRQGEPMQHTAAVNSIAFSPDGKIIVAGYFDGTVELWNANTGQSMNRLLRPGDPDSQVVLRHGARVSQVAFSPDDRIWLSVGENKTVRWWSVESQIAMVPPISLDAKIVSAGFSPNGRYVMASTADAVRIWETESGRSFGEPINPVGQISAAAFTPDANAMNVVVACTDGTAQYWDFQTGQPRSGVMKHPAAVSAFAFNPDGQSLLTASDQTAYFWKVPKGEALGQPLPHDGAVRSVSFRHDGQVALTGCDDHTARMWDVATCQPIGKPLLHESPVIKVVFSPDGLAVLSCCHDGTVTLWEATSCKPLCQICPPHSGPILTIFSPDGMRILSANSATELQLWNVPKPLPDNPEFVKAWVDVHAGVRVTENGTIEPLAAEQLQQAEATLKLLQKPFDGT